MKMTESGKTLIKSFDEISMIGTEERRLGKNLFRLERR
jgi:hypothetical protein